MGVTAPLETPGLVTDTGYVGGYGMSECAGNPALPDVADGICCIGAAVYGPSRCTCWEPIYDMEQQPQVPGLVATAQPTQCADCAYRPRSPERQNTEGYGADSEELDDMVTRGAVFWCHQGMRRVVRLRHESTGIEIPGHPASYRPGIAVYTDPDGQHTAVALRADGTPADVCAGWLARRLAFMQEGMPRG